MTLWIEAIVALVCSYVVALALWPMMVRLPGRWIGAMSFVALPLVPYVGLSVGPDATSIETQRVRIVIVILSSAMAALCFLYWQRARHYSFGKYARFLIVGAVNPYPIVPVKTVSPNAERLLPEFARLSVAAAAIVLAWKLAETLLSWGMDYLWLVNYLVVVVAFLVITHAGAHLVLALGRMTGYRGKPLVDRIWLSRTPADFWRRWNWPAHVLFYHYVFVPCGGRKRVVWATFMVFLVSGLAHELMATAGLGRVTWHQTAFFLVNGLGVIASPQLERLAAWGVPGELAMRLTTIAFMLTTGVLMFATINYFVPLFQMPAWLAW